MTRIGWVADHFYPHVKRGAELHTRILIEEGKRRGYDIVECEGKIVKDVDLYIVGTCVDNFNAGELLAYLSRKPYVNMEHDLRAPHMAWYKMFASQALINVFRSPLHVQIINRISGNYKHFLHPNCIPEQFKDLGLKRKPKNQVLYAGDYSWEKGYRGLLDWIESHPKATLWHYGAGFPKKHSRMKEMGQTSYEEMPKIYNQFQSMIFLPNYPQACCRIMCEAFLCKVQNIITNDKSGFMSYNFKMKDYEKVRELLVNGHKKWWNKVKEFI